MFLLLSDLHLGAADALDDFILWGESPAGPVDRAATARDLDSVFAAFLSDRMAEAAAPPTLVLNGDTFDLWQVRRPRERPRAALERILAAHAGAVAALRGWIGSGGAIELVVGNHDHELLDPAAWALLTEVLPGLNRRAGGQPAHFFANAEAGLYAEHGNRLDPFNRFRRIDNPRARCAGERLVRLVVNRLEPTVPLIDKATSLAATVRMALSAEPALREILPFRADTAERQAVALARGLRRALARRPGSTAGPMPADCRFLVTGHTHLAGRSPAVGGVEHIDSGTWRPLWIEKDGGHMIQPLDYVVVARNQSGRCEAALLHHAAITPPASSTAERGAASAAAAR